jgi:hypothetical protein
VTIEQYQDELIALNSLYQVLGRISIFAKLGMPEAEKRYIDTVAELDYCYARLLDGWPAARDDQGVIEGAKVARRLLNTLGEAA